VISDENELCYLKTITKKKLKVMPVIMKKAVDIICR
jgi:hypothetical protein